MELDLSTKIGKLRLDSCVYNGACPLSSSDYDFKNLESSSSAIINTKTCTMDAKSGNEFPTYYTDGSVGINSIGLKNPGFEYYHKLHDSYSKRMIISIWGSFEELRSMISTGVDVEINLSCPNVNKKIIGYDPELLRECLNSILLHTNKDQVIGLKLPPYLRCDEIENIARVIAEYPVDYIVCSNTLGNGLLIDNDKEQTRIRPNSGHGGISGIKAISLGNVRMFSKLLPEIDIVGCGGVKTGQDVFEYVLAGASAVQVCTQFLEEGVDVFKRLEHELEQIMTRKGYRCLKDFKGRLMTRSKL